MVKRANKIELQNRIDMLLTLKAKGYSYSQLVAVGAEHWNVSERELKRYLSAAKKIEMGFSQVQPNEQLGVIGLRLEHLYRQVALGDDPLLILKVTKGLMELEVLKQKLLGKGGQANEPTSRPQIPEEDELAGLLRALESRGPASK